MKRRETRPLGAIIENMIDATGLRPQYQRHSIEAVWPQVVGKHINDYTGRIYVEGTVLKVHIVSASLKEELSYLRPLLVRQLNEAAGAEIINDIKIL